MASRRCGPFPLIRVQGAALEVAFLVAADAQVGLLPAYGECGDGEADQFVLCHATCRPTFPPGVDGS